MKCSVTRKKARIKKDDVVNVISSDGKTISGKVKNVTRHSLGAVYIEIEGGAK